MNSFEVIDAGIATSIQDLGRKNVNYYAIPKSGVLDRTLLTHGYYLLDLESETPVIECIYKAPSIRFSSSCQIALLGADFSWRLNKQKLPLNRVIEVGEGDILEGSFAKQGFTGFIVLNGLIQCQKVFGSYSTYTNAKIGGHAGRLLKKGDQIEFKTYHPVEGKSISSDLNIRSNMIGIRKGPEFHLLNNESKDLLVNSTYKVGADSNRMGLRLEGGSLISKAYQLKSSRPVLPGFVQLPPNGQLIVLLNDGQVSGGYPRIAYVPFEFLSPLSQIPIGGKVNFNLLE